MWFWTVLFLSLFVVQLINEFGIFPYYSYFDDKGTFWIRKYFFFKTPLDLNTVIRATLIFKITEDPTPYIELWTTEKFYIIRQAGIFCYKQNLKLLNKIIQINPKIDMSNAQIRKYMGAKTQKGIYIIDEHVGSYILLIVSFLFTLYFLCRSLVG